MDDVHRFYRNRDRRRVPPDWRVRIARHISLHPRHPLTCATLSTKIMNDGGDRLRVHFSTIAVGHLVLQVRLQPEGWRRTVAREDFGEDVAPRIDQATERLRWKPEYSLTHDTFEIIANAATPDGPVSRAW